MIGRWTRIRVVLCGLALAGAAFLIGRRAFDLQVRQSDKLRSWAEDNYLKEIEIPPQRGRIYDRNGSELASTTQFDSVFANPRTLANVPDGIRQVARVLDLDQRDLRKMLSGRRYFAWVKRKVTPAEAAAVKELGLAGLGIKKEPRRVYPFGDLAATVVGHAGLEGRGLEGVEMAYDYLLHGEASQVQGIRDALGRELLIDGLADPVAAAGKDIVLSLDKFLSYTTERALAAAVKRHSAKGAVGIVMDPRTGEILAMASVPTYDLNDPKDAAQRCARNRAVTDTYEPGSTMKTFTFAAALDGGKVRPDEWFDCQMGRMVVGANVIRDSHPMASLTAAQVLQQSSNIGTVKIARRVGREGLWDAFKRFGFGKPTGVGLPGEQGGTLRPVAKWSEIGFANLAFGQGLTVTPLQMATGYAAVASGGVYHPPRLALKMVHPDGRAEAMPPGAKARGQERIMSQNTARTLLGIMRGVTEPGGTATEAAIEGYPVAGKTGTAQKVVNGHYHDDYWVASFIGIVPADDPRFVIVVVIDEPKPMHLGGMVAAPVFKEIGEAALRYLGVPPSQPIAVNKKKVKKAKVSEEVAEGFGSDVVAVAPGGEEEAGDDVEGVVQEQAGDQTGDVAVPSFKGMSMGEVIRAARRAGVEVALEGSGVAVTQSPAPGSILRARQGKFGLLCRVSFRPGG